MSVMGSCIYPVAMAMGFPVFLYLIVLEKEKKLLEIMKINGMRMYNYWISNFTFNFFIYNITALSFMLFGSKVYNMSFFSETNFFVLYIVLAAWGLL